jgi:hypothetical protein
MARGERRRGTRGSKTGATGLEPATSGVTGQIGGGDMNDDGHGVALLMRV